MRQDAQKQFVRIGEFRYMELSEIAGACRGELHIGSTAETEYEITGTVIDSRKVQPGNLFVATKGERVDGHSFIPAAVEKGCAAVVCERKPECDVTYILVQDSFRALRDIAEYYRATLQILIVGITGSVGKTSTKEFVASVLGQRFRTWKTPGNLNNEVGLPLTVLSIRPEHEAAVLEMGISEFGEMHRLSKIARPNLAVITNIGMCHLENLKSRDGILRAKTEIFDYLSEDGRVFLCGDDDKLITVRDVKGRKPVFFGLGSGNEITAAGIVNRGLLGSNCTIRTPKGNFEVRIPLPGEHMVVNALAATAVGLKLGLSLEEIRSGIEAVQAVDGRSHVIETPNYTLIDDCYNANPVSMKAAIDLLKTADTRTVAVLGDMFELGANECGLHAEVGTYAVDAGIQVLICTGKLCRFMYEAAEQRKGSIGTGRTDIYYAEDRDALLALLPGILQKQDTILVKASHSMGFEQVISQLERL